MGGLRMEGEGGMGVTGPRVGDGGKRRWETLDEGRDRLYSGHL